MTSLYKPIKYVSIYVYKGICIMYNGHVIMQVCTIYIMLEIPISI